MVASMRLALPLCVCRVYCGAGMRCPGRRSSPDKSELRKLKQLRDDVGELSAGDERRLRALIRQTERELLQVRFARVLLLLAGRNCACAAARRAELKMMLAMRTGRGCDMLHLLWCR